MAIHTYTGSAQPALSDLPVSVNATSFTGGSGVVVFSSVPPLNTFYFLEVRAAVGNKVYSKGVLDSSLQLTFLTTGDFKVTLIADNFRPKSFMIKVR